MGEDVKDLIARFPAFENFDDEFQVRVPRTALQNPFQR